MFASYHEEFSSLRQSILTRLGQVSTDLEDSPTQRRNMLRQLESDIQQAESLLNQMNVESRTASSSEYKSTVSESRNHLKNLKTQFEEVKSKIERQELLSRGTLGDDSVGLHDSIGGSEAASGSRREMRRFEEVTRRMDASTESLLQSKRTLAETEEIAMDITSNLSSNRESILSAHDRIRETGGFLGQGQRLLRKMQARESRRKLILTGLFVFLFLVFILILYLAFKK